MEVRPGYKQTEVGVIPEDWNLSSIQAFAEIRGRVGWKGYTKKDLVAYGPYAIGAKHIDGNNRLNFSDPTFLSQSKYLESPEIMVRTGDILIVQRGTIGKLVLVDGHIGEATINPSMVIIRTRNISAGFVTYYLLSHSGQKQILADTSTTGVPMISQKQIEHFLVPLPPTKAEQEAIAETLSDTDALIESLEQLIAKKRHLKKGAMQELLTGKKRLPGFSGEWAVKRFGAVVQPRKERIDPRRTGRQEFCIELEHIEQGTGCLAGYTATTEGSSLKSVFRKDDILFGKLRAYLRKYWLANLGGVCSTEIWVLTATRALIIPQFLFQIVKVDRFIEVASSAYGTHMPRSDWNVVKNYEVRLPPAPEQTAIAAILSDMDAEIAALGAKLAKVSSLKQGMMQELLTGRTRLV